MLLIVTKDLGRLLPAGVAQKVGADSEGFLLALVLPLWIQFVRPRLRGASAWLVPLLAASFALIAGVVLYRTTTVTSSIKTLNETLLALAVLLPYVQRRRPLPTGVALGTVTLVGVLILLGDRLPLVTRLAEAFGMLLLVPLALDIVDRGVLDPQARTSARLRWFWYAALLLLPLAVAALHRADLAGLPGTVVSYAARAQEAFVGVLLLNLYLAVALGRTGRMSTSAGSVAVPAGPRAAHGATR